MWNVELAEAQALIKIARRRPLRVPYDSKRIKLVNPEGNQPWIFTGKTDAEVETPTLWPLDAKSRLIEKDPDAGKDRGLDEKGAVEYEMVVWHHQFNGHESEQTLGDSEGPGSLARCSPWGCRESNMAEWLNSNTGWARAFSNCGMWGLFSSCGARAFHCGGFSCCEAQAVGNVGFSSWGPRVLLPHSMWDLPGVGLKPVSPAFQGVFLTTGPAGKPTYHVFGCHWKW